jgi:O-antigen ligase
VLSTVSEPLIVVGVASAVIGVVALSTFGELAVLGLLLFAVPCIPVVGPHGDLGAQLRMVLLGVLTGGAALLYLQSRIGEAKPASIPLPVHRVALALYWMAAVGAGVAVGSAGDVSEFGRILLKTSGQPLLYAVLLLTLVSALSTSPRAKRVFLFGWALSVIVQAGVVAFQLASGGAYDPLRQLTRAKGTIGADFLGAFSVMGLFGALYFRATARDRSERLIATVAAMAAAGALIASVSRGPLIGLGVSLLYLVFEAAPVRSGRRAAATIMAVIALVGGALYIGRGLWTDRLNYLDKQNTGSFDRPATWVSGLLIAQDHPLTGVGPDGVVVAVRDNPRYSQNQFGSTGVNPHNSWIFGLAEGGFLYGGALVLVTVLLFVAVLRRPRRQGDHFLIAALISGGAVFFANNLFTHPEIVLYVLLSAAILLSTPRWESGSEP